MFTRNSVLDFLDNMSMMVAMTDASVIEALGGATVLAAALVENGYEVDREAIYKWKERDFIPWKWRGRVAAIASRSNVSLPDCFVDSDPEGGPRQPEPSPPDELQKAS